MDDWDIAAHPHCPECGTVMRDVAGGGAVCAGCRIVLSSTSTAIPPVFDGPAIHGG